MLLGIAFCCKRTPADQRGAFGSLRSEGRTAPGVEFGRKPQLTPERIAQLSSVVGTVEGMTDFLFILDLATS
jgi:hypothetical protein